MFRQGIVQLAIGLGAGLASAVASSRALEALLVGVSTWDHATLAAVLVAAGVLGCAAPARRALRVNPVIALRRE